MVKAAVHLPSDGSGPPGVRFGCAFAVAPFLTSNLYSNKTAIRCGARGFRSYYLYLYSHLWLRLETTCQPRESV